METEHVFDGLWRIFSRLSTLKAVTVADACKRFSIDLNSQQLTSLSTDSYNRKQWMHLLKDDSMNESMMTKFTELRSQYLKDTASDNIKTDKNTLYCYQWRLPRYQPSQLALLCHAFIRQSIDVLIPNDIINIMVNYLFVNVVNTIRMDEDKERLFESGVFEYKSCKFIIRLSTYDGLRISIFLLSAPNDIEVRWDITFVEKFMNFKISKKYSCIWSDEAIASKYCELIQDDIQHLKSMTFNVCIQKFICYDGNYEIESAQNPDAPLLIEQKLTEPAVNALKLMFTPFASNEDDTMSIEDMKNYIIHCCGNDRSASNTRIQNIFNQHGTETSAVENRLSFEGFLDFYKVACIDRPDAVWHDLRVFNFGYDSRRKSDDDKFVYMTPIILDEMIGQSENGNRIVWKLSNEQIEQIKNATANDIIRSTILNIHGLKFQLWLYVCYDMFEYLISPSMTYSNQYYLAHR